MAFEVNDLRGFLFLVLLALPMTVARNIDCHGRGFHCVNSTHFMICVDLGIGISTTIDDFIIPCPPTTVCHKHNIFECEFPKFEITTPPLEVIGVSKRSDTSETTVVSTSVTSAPLTKVSSVTYKPISILSTPEEITPVPELEVLKSFKEYTETKNEKTTKAEVITQPTPSPLITEKVNLDDFVPKYDKSVVVSSVSKSDTNNLEPAVETSLDKAVKVSLPDISVSIDSTTPTTGLLNSTLSTFAPEPSASAVTQNSYRKDNNIINQTNDSSTINQNDTGLSLFGDITSTEKMQVYSLDTFTNTVTPIENTQTSTETTFIVSEDNVTKTTPRDKNVYTDPILKEKTTAASPINSLPTADILADPNPILINRNDNTKTNTIDKVEPSTTTTTTTTTTSINLGVGSTNEPSFKVEISQTVSNITTNEAYNATSSTTVSFNISDALENHLVVNNDSTKPIINHVEPKSITVNNNEDQMQLDKLPSDLNITEAQNDLPYNTNNHVNQRALDVNKYTKHVQDKINPLITDLNNTEGTPKGDVIRNETVVLQTSDYFNSPTRFNPIQVQNEINNTDVEPTQTKPTLLVLNSHADNASVDVPLTPVTNITTIGSPIEKVTDKNIEIINNIAVTDIISVNNTTIQLELTKPNTVTSQNATTLQEQAFAVPNQVANTDKEFKIEQLTTIPPLIEKVSAVTFNSSVIDNITEVAVSNKTVLKDELNKAEKLSDVNNIIAISESTVKPYIGENTTPMTTLKPTHFLEDLQLNGTIHQSKSNDTVLLNITENTILTDYNTATTQNIAIDNNTVTEYEPEVSIIQNVTKTKPQINSRKSLPANVSTSTAFVANITPTTNSIPSNEVLLLNHVYTLNETTLAPLTTTVNETQTTTYETTTNFPVPLNTAANLVTQSTLASVDTIKAPFIDVLHETKPAANDETNYLNLSTETSVDFSSPKTVIVEELRQVKEPIFKTFEKTEPTLHIEDVTTSPMVQTVPSIATTEYVTTKLLNYNVDNLAQTQGVVISPENVVESTTSVTSLSPLTTVRIQHEENTSTTEMSQTNNTVSQNLQNATHIVDVPRITDVEINQTSSFILQDFIKSTTTQDLGTSTTTIKSTTVDEITSIQKPILRVFEELLPVTPFMEKKSLPTVTITTTPTPKENMTIDLRDNKVDNSTIEDLKTAMNLESNHTSIFKQEVVAPLRDVIENNTSQTTQITPITERNEPLPLIKEVTESSTFIYDKSPPALKVLESKAIPETFKTQITLTPTVKLSDASFHYILPNIRSTEQPLSQSSLNIYSTLPLNGVTTQQVLNSVTPPDSMVETIQVNGGQTSATSHLGLVVIKNLTVNTNLGDNSAKHIDREYIENVTSINNIEREVTWNVTTLNDIDEKIKTEEYTTPNNGNIDVNITIDIFSNKEEASVDLKRTSETQNKKLSTISIVDVKPHEDPLINLNTVKYEETPIMTNKPYTVSQYLLQPITVKKDGSEIVSSANNNHVNLEINNVNFVNTSSSNVPQDLKTPNTPETSTTLNNQEVNLEKHDNAQINGTGNELKPDTSKPSDFKPIVTNKQLQASSKDKNNTAAAATPFNCSNRTRGKYADKKDCRKFYTCVGNLQPLIGICPTNTVFSDINKQCTRNLSHCVRNNQFRCLLEGRFNDFFKDNIYYICIKNTKNKFIRYKFKCNSDYHLNRILVKCEKNAINSSQSSSSVSENSRVNDESLSAIERETSKKTFNTQFECEDEGSFSHSNDCSKYYECTKVKDVYRRKLKKCASDEVFDKERKQCVKSDSTEC